MKYVLLILSAVVLLSALSTAQITFTREWVTGKRSSPFLSAKPSGESSCKTNLMPAIKYLIEIDNILREFCGPQYLQHQAVVHPFPGAEYQFPWNLHSKPGTGDQDENLNDPLSQKPGSGDGSRK